MKILLYSPDNGVTKNFMPHLWMFLLQSLTPPGHEVVLIDGNAQPMDEAGIAQRQISAGEITDRCLYGLVNEGARILEEGYALRASDIDIIYLNGYGFPAHRGGPMWYADTVGLKQVCDRVSEFHRQHGEIWRPAPLLKRLADEGKRFADFGKEEGAAA